MNSRNLLVALLLATIGSVSAGWSSGTSARLHDSTNLASLYTDFSTSRTYIFYGYNKTAGVNKESYLCFQEFSANGDLMRSPCFQQKRMVENVSVAGDSDGQHIYLLYSARRKMRSTSCAGGLNEGCYDVFFMETKDNGETWTEPAPVNHAVNDGYNRYMPSIISVPSTKRLHIVYVQGSPRTKGEFIYHNTRASGSIVFGPAKAIGAWPSIESLFLGHMVKGASPVLVLVCECVGTKLQFYYSLNGGNSFSSFKVREDAKAYSLSFSMDYYNHEQIYLVSLGDNGKHMIHWFDRNLAWHTRELTYYKVDGFRPLIATVPNVSNTVLLTGAMEHSAVSTYVFNTEFESLKDNGDAAPVKMMGVSCGFATKSSYQVRAAHAIGTDLYTSAYTFPLSDNTDVIVH